MTDKIAVGTKFFHVFSFSQAQVQQFADLTGDDNPLHLDEAYAATTKFGRCIIHGHLSSSVFTKYLGTQKPGGPGSVYIRQVTEYKRPMFVDTLYEVMFEVMSVDSAKHIAEIRTEIKNKETGKITITGTGTLLNETNF
jgi:acyl dehydratase